MYAVSHLHCNLAHHNAYATDPGTALCDAFRKTDDGFTNKAKIEVGLIKLFFENHVDKKN